LKQKYKKNIKNNSIGPRELNFMQYNHIKELSIPHTETPPCLELLDCVVKLPALHLSTVNLVCLAGHSLLQVADSDLGLPQGGLAMGESGGLHRELGLVEREMSDTYALKTKQNLGLQQGLVTSRNGSEFE
jgi:hypothetical protein